MELIPINESKLKIMLNESDMKEYNIGEESDCANSETRHAIRNILSKVKSEIGFDTEGEEIFVQLYTSKSGGCELFVTKSGKVGTSLERKKVKRDKKNDDMSHKPQEKECLALTIPNGTQAKPYRSEFGKMAFSFEKLSDLCRACRILKHKQQDIKSQVWLGENKVYYLFLDNANISAYSHLDRLTFINEFGKREHVNSLITYVFEHGKAICRENAIEILSNF